MKEIFLSLFIASFLFFIISAVPDEFFFPAVALGTLALGLLIFRFIGNLEALSFLLLSLAYVLIFPLEHVNTLYMQMGMGLFSLYFLWDKRDALLRGKEKRRLWRRALDGILLFALMLVAGITMNMALSLAGFNDSEKALDVVQGLPPYLLVAAFILVPVSEELFFRGLLIQAVGKYTGAWAGALVSSAIFGVTHASYGSVVEIIGAALLGMVLAAYYVRKGDLLPCIIAHTIFNFLSIFTIKVLMG